MRVCRGGRDALRSCACTSCATRPLIPNDQRNAGIQAPWNFDTNWGGFTVGLTSPSDDALIAETIALWGEDKNFNDKLDGRCNSEPSRACDRFPTDPTNCGVGGDFTCINLEDRDPQNFPTARLDRARNTEGGCGWQTKAPGTCSGNLSVGCYTDRDHLIGMLAAACLQAALCRLVFFRDI